MEAFDKSVFYESIIAAQKMQNQVDFRVSGGIVPHHLVAGFIIADFFRSIQKQNIGTFIIIGPNHYETGEPVITSGSSWQTEFGMVEADTGLQNRLVSLGLAAEDPGVIVKEHSISAIIPYIAYYCPGARVVPVILKHGAEYEKVSEFLSKTINDSFVIIASVDFSHYLCAREAKENDNETRQMLFNFDIESIQSHGRNNDFFDSPASLCTILSVMRARGAMRIKILHNTNSGILSGLYDVETTSYFGVAFYR